MAAGVPVDEARVAAACMDKRRARGDGLSTARVEADQVQFLSGVVNGHTTGTAIALMIENQNTRSGDYAKTADLLRPGHADYTAYAKYHGFQDARGGGHFSGRITAALVAGGAIVLDALSRAGIDISTHIARCAGISDTPFALDDPAALAAQAEALVGKPEGFALLDPTVEEPMKAAIRAAGADGDSVGGILETAILGLPAGLGEPYFDSVESLLAHAAFSIPAVKGIEFGTGFGLRTCVAPPPTTRSGWTRSAGSSPGPTTTRASTAASPTECLSSSAPLSSRRPASTNSRIRSIMSPARMQRSPSRAAMTPASCPAPPSCRPAPPLWWWAT